MKTPFWKVKRWFRKIGKEKQICPRRHENPQSFERFPGGDYWVKKGKWHTCSYCGSMKSSDIFKAIEEFGAQILEPSDKGYKCYIRIPGVHNASDGPIKFYTPHLSKEEIDKLNTIMSSFRKAMVKYVKENYEKWDETQKAQFRIPKTIPGIDNLAFWYLSYMLTSMGIDFSQIKGE